MLSEFLRRLFVQGDAVEFSEDAFIDVELKVRIMKSKQGLAGHQAKATRKASNEKKKNEQSVTDFS